MKRLLLLIISLLGLTVVIFLVFLAYAQKPKPEHIHYGSSFNTLYAEELGLDWREVYDAQLNDLAVRHLRLAAHWTMVEPEPGVYNFTELDYQIKRAEEVGADVVLAVGRRLPRWPECHIPDWAEGMSSIDEQKHLLAYIEAVVERYKDSPAITYWQVENEPFLEVFALEHCGELDEKLLEIEIALVRHLDSSRPILVTDSGNLGTWFGPYRNSDAFGTSVYVYFWNQELGKFRTILPPWVYWVKEALVGLVYGDKETILIELSAEPWLLEPISQVPIETQFTRMNLDYFEDILKYAEQTRFEKQYLWGVEWWYWLKTHGHPEFWDRAKKLYATELL